MIRASHSSEARSGTSAELAGRAARGAAWTISVGLVTRVLGMIGTLLLTYFLDPNVLGEVYGASILVMTANALGTVGVGQYVIAKKGVAGRDVTWHATVVHQVLGLLVMGLLFASEPWLVAFLHSPNIVRLAPGFVLSVLVDRVSFIPERVLARDMRFGVLSASRMAGEIAFSVGSVAFAMAGFGGMALVLGNIARSLLRSGIVLRSVDRREWLTPCRFSPRILRDLFRFGWPLCVGGVAELAARRWDNLGIERLFGPWVMGEYNQAYNLAEIPGTQIGEQMGDVLLPTLADLDLQGKKRALVRTLGLMSLIVFPLSLGLAVVAPTIVRTLLRPEWRGVGPMLTVLAALSIVRPFGWTISAYLQARDRTRPVLWLDVSKVVTLVGLIAVMGLLGGPLWACAGAGLAYGANALVSMWVVQQLDGVPVTAFLAECCRPLLACAPMMLAVLAVRAAIEPQQFRMRGLDLAIEIATGAAVYAPVALVVARERAADLIRLLRGIARSGSRVADAAST